MTASWLRGRAHTHKWQQLLGNTPSTPFPAPTLEPPCHNPLGTLLPSVAPTSFLSPLEKYVSASSLLLSFHFHSSGLVCSLVENPLSYKCLFRIFLHLVHSFFFSSDSYPVTSFTCLFYFLSPPFPLSFPNLFFSPFTSQGLIKHPCIREDSVNSELELHSMKIKSCA